MATTRKPGAGGARVVAAPMARASAVPKAAGRELKIVGAGLKTGKVAPAWRPVERTQFLIDSVGGVTKLARTLGSPLASRRAGSLARRFPARKSHPGSWISIT